MPSLFRHERATPTLAIAAKNANNDNNNNIAQMCVSLDFCIGIAGIGGNIISLCRAKNNKL